MSSQASLIATPTLAPRPASSGLRGEVVPLRPATWQPARYEPSRPRGLAMIGAGAAVGALLVAFLSLGIVAAVLGVVKAMGALDQSPEILGGLIGAALVGTFLGIVLSYAVVGPVATKIKTVREKKNRLYIIVKQTLLAYMNGALPQVAIEFGRKTISSYERPTIDAVEQSTMNTGGADKKAA